MSLSCLSHMHFTKKAGFTSLMIILIIVLLTTLFYQITERNDIDPLTGDNERKLLNDSRETFQGESFSNFSNFGKNELEVLSGSRETFQGEGSSKFSKLGKNERKGFSNASKFEKITDKADVTKFLDGLRKYSIQDTSIESQKFWRTYFYSEKCTHTTICDANTLIGSSKIEAIEELSCNPHLAKELMKDKSIPVINRAVAQMNFCRPDMRKGREKLILIATSHLGGPMDNSHISTYNKLLASKMKNACSLTNDHKRLAEESSQFAVMFINSQNKFVEKFSKQRKSNQIWIGGCDPDEEQVNFNISYTHCSDSNIPKLVSFFIRNPAKTEIKNNITVKLRTDRPIFAIPNDDELNRDELIELFKKHQFDYEEYSLFQTRRNKIFLNVTSNTVKFIVLKERKNCSTKMYNNMELFFKALDNGVLPIIIGASEEPYKSVAPDNSFLFFDSNNFTESDLIEYSNNFINENKFVEYLKWKNNHLIFDINPFVQVCSILHALKN